MKPLTPKELSLATETIAHLHVKTGTKAGMRNVGSVGNGTHCLSVGQGSTCVSMCSGGTFDACCA